MALLPYKCGCSVQSWFTAYQIGVEHLFTTDARTKVTKDTLLCQLDEDRSSHIKSLQNLLLTPCLVPPSDIRAPVAVMGSVAQVQEAYAHRRAKD